MERYDHQLSLPEIGTEGQEKLSSASVLVVGLGGLGSALSYCLAGMGVGRLTVMDPDRVSLKNLDRQFLYEETDVGKFKAYAAAQRLTAFNCHAECHPIIQAFTADSGAELVASADLVLAATDTITSRLELNAACCQEGVPLICGGVNGMYGSLQIVFPGRTACIRCIADAEQEHLPAPSFVPVVTALSALMAQAAAGVLCGWALPSGQMVLLDGKRFELEHIPLNRRRDCPCCGGLCEELPC